MAALTTTPIPYLQLAEFVRKLGFADVNVSKTLAKDALAGRDIRFVGASLLELDELESEIKELAMPLPDERRPSVFILWGPGHNSRPASRSE